MPGPFQGTLNGFTLGATADAPEPQDFSPKCTGTNGRRGGQADLAGSPLDFDLTYVPSNGRLGSVFVGLCEDEVISVEKNFILDSGSLQVTRNSGPPFFTSDVGDMLVAATIGGRDAVINDRAPPPRAVYLRDAESTWKVVGRLDIQELIRVAEGLRSK
jgi:hypothetical protein